MGITRWLEEEEMNAWRALLRGHGLLTNRLDEELLAEAGMSLAEYEVLVHLSDAPDNRLRMSDLAGQVLLSRSGLTRRVDALVERGWVTRQPCPSDRRAVHAVLSPAGRTRLHEVAAIHLGGVRAHFVDLLSAADLADLQRILSVVVRHLSPTTEDDAGGCGEPKRVATTCDALAGPEA